MWNKFAVLTLVAAPFVALPAVAQQAPSDQPAAAEAQQSTTLRAKADALSGMDVYSSDGQLVGKVAAAIADPNSNVEEIHVDVGAELGIGEKRVSIDADRFNLGEDRIDLSITAAEVQGLPEAQ